MRTLSENIERLVGLTVLVRCNYDVPMDDGEVMDTTRIEDALDTIRLLRENNCRVVLLAHQGRPDGKFDESISLRPVAELLEKLLGEKVTLTEYRENPSDLKVSSENMITLVENLRFWAGEEENNQEFAQVLASWGQAYVNEAFANCHRDHASMVGLPNLVPGYVGLKLEREIKIMNEVLDNPKRPLTVVIGGAKLETKAPLVQVFADKADHILVGGKIAIELQTYTEPLPSCVNVASLIEDSKDITEESAREFAQVIMDSGTVIWNGTMGMFEDKSYKTGTRIVAEAVDKTNAFTLVGGGDTEAALTELDLEDKIDFISTGGGAMLKYLSTHSLVALEPLRKL